MRLAERWPAVLVTAVVIGGIGILVSRLVAPSAGSAMVTVKVPELSQAASAGKQAFDKICAQCHGTNGAGSDKGPPLIHDLYNPGHHDDAAFVSAVKRGAPSHHWNFGDMPPQPTVSDREIAAIIRYVRELQAANGIRYRRHRM